MAGSSDSLLKKHNSLSEVTKEHSELIERYLRDDMTMDLAEVYKLCRLVPRYMAALSLALHYVDRSALDFLEPMLAKTLRGDK